MYAYLVFSGSTAVPLIREQLFPLWFAQKIGPRLCPAPSGAYFTND